MTLRGEADPAGRTQGMRRGRRPAWGMVALAFLALRVLTVWLAEPWSLHLMPQAGLAALAAAALSAVLRLWPAAGGPFMQIDYIFHDGFFAPTRRIDDVSGAEHYSVQADLAFAG